MRRKKKRDGSRRFKIKRRKWKRRMGGELRNRTRE